MKELLVILISFVFIWAVFVQEGFGDIFDSEDTEVKPDSSLLETVNLDLI